MVGSVQNSNFVAQINICEKLKVACSHSATSHSPKPLQAILEILSRNIVS